MGSARPPAAPAGWPGRCRPPKQLTTQSNRAQGSRSTLENAVAKREAFARAHGAGPRPAVAGPECAGQNLELALMRKPVSIGVPALLKQLTSRTMVLPPPCAHPVFRPQKLALLPVAV